MGWKSKQPAFKMAHINQNAVLILSCFRHSDKGAANVKLKQVKAEGKRGASADFSSQPYMVYFLICLLHFFVATISEPGTGYVYIAP